MSDSTLSTPLWCSVMPSVQHSWARSAVAQAWASSTMASAGTPVTASPRSSVHSSTDAAYSSKPDVARSMNASLCQAGVDDLAGRSCSTSAMSVPTLRPSQHVGPAGRAGPARVDAEQARAVAHAGEDVVEEDRVGLPGVRAPEDDDVGVLDLAVRGRAAACSEHCRQTDDARERVKCGCRSRCCSCRWPCASNFWATKFISLVAFEHENIPTESGPRSATARRKPSAARVERLVPRGGAEPAALPQPVPHPVAPPLPHQGLGQPGVGLLLVLLPHVVHPLSTLESFVIDVSARPARPECVARSPSRRWAAHRSGTRAFTLVDVMFTIVDGSGFLTYT